MISDAGILVTEVIADNLRQCFYHFYTAEVFCLWSNTVSAEHDSCQTPVLQKMRNYLRRHVQFRFVKLQILGLYVNIRMMT